MQNFRRIRGGQELCSAEGESAPSVATIEEGWPLLAGPRHRRFEVIWRGTALVDDITLMNLFAPLYSDLKPERTFAIRRPLLAHYTSVQTLEKILLTNEVWFSNPLFMNDIEEVRFGVLQGISLVLNNEGIVEACKTKERFAKFRKYFTSYTDSFINEHSLDIYVFCLSEHHMDDDDGLLSMWRGYGADGSGVAIVFNTQKLVAIDNSPLILAEVTYESTQNRILWLNSTLSQFSSILLKADIPDERLYIPAYSLFERIKLFALFTKHHGFKEEREWRVVYMVDKDKNRQYEKMFHYWVGPKGVEPKLRFKVEPANGATSDDLSLLQIVDRIILGPSISSPLAVAAVSRMLERLSYSALKNRLRSSTIPFRA
jgi:hypothetical protein